MSPHREEHNLNGLAGPPPAGHEQRPPDLRRLVRHRRRLVVLLAALALAGALVGGVAWLKLYREQPEPAMKADEQWFMYGSLGGERLQSIPYWIWMVLPRVFSDLMPGPYGYRSFGVVWEEGVELPVGFTKRTVGFPRIGINCALCHATSYRNDERSIPSIAIGGPAHTVDVQGMLRFLAAAANDSRFNASALLSEIGVVTKLSFVDRLLYRFVIIPRTRRALIEQGQRNSWMDRPTAPNWGPGRQDAPNTAKYLLAHLPVDGRVGQSDFGSAWNASARDGPALRLNWGGESPTVNTVLVDCALAVGARPGREFDADMKRLRQVLGHVQPPRWPFSTDPVLVTAGRGIFERRCAGCHEQGHERYGRVVPIEEIGTDRERLESWTQATADAVNHAIQDRIGARRPDLAKTQGYLAQPLDGVWLRAPYLHNGSVPNLRELLEAPEKRSKVFYRGYDVLDPASVGFKAFPPETPDARREATRTGEDPSRFFRFDTALRGNGNGGHGYGVDLSPADKAALLEYLKTL